jgi:hypothetical protein
VLIDESSDLFSAQPITFESMRQARRFAEGRVEVELFSAQYPEDACMVPADFRRTPDLIESVLDYGTFDQRRKLPLLRDILDSVYQASGAEYLVYTNVDIGLLPHFYLAVDEYIAAGYDAFVINRRTISDQYCDIQHLPRMYAEVGQPHRGWDCFVFRRETYPLYDLGHVCVGAPRVGLALLANLIAHAICFREFNTQHATFHIGNDRAWGRSQYSDFAAHNTEQALQIIERLEQKTGAFQRSTPPGRFLFYHRHLLLRILFDAWARFYVPLHVVHPLRRGISRLQFWR